VFNFIVNISEKFWKIFPKFLKKILRGFSALKSGKAACVRFGRHIQSHYGSESTTSSPSTVQGRVPAANAFYAISVINLSCIFVNKAFHQLSTIS